MISLIGMTSSNNGKQGRLATTAICSIKRRLKGAIFMLRMYSKLPLRSANDGMLGDTAHYAMRVS